jgi:glycosyl transferase family 1
VTKLVYLGNFQHTFSTETHICNDAERIPGVTVDRVQEPGRHAEHAQFLDALIERCDGADLLVYQKTWGLDPSAVNAWREIERHGCQTASWHLDLYVGLERQREIGMDAFWRTGTVFTADGDPNTAWAMREHGINHVWLPPACVSDQCVPGCWREEMAADIVFVGSAAGYHHEYPFRQDLIHGLTKRYGPRFQLWGAGRHVRDDALNDLMASAKIVVGDSLLLHGHVNYFSDRYFETVGRGGFLIAPKVPGIEQFFRGNDHLVYFRPLDLDHCFAKIDYWLDQSDEDRHAIAKSGQAHVARAHTYKRRVQTVLDTLGIR